MSTFSGGKPSVYSAAVDGLSRIFRRKVVAEPSPIFDGVQHRVAILRVRDGRIIEQSARLNGC